MANSRDDESSSQVPILSTIDMCLDQYKKTIEKLSVKMFNILKRMTSAHEEIDKLNAINEKLKSRNEELESIVIHAENLKQEVDYLKNKVPYASQIEHALREQIAEIELKAKAYKNSSILVQTYHEKNQENYKAAIVFDYETLKKKREYF